MDNSPRLETMSWTGLLVDPPSESGEAPQFGELWDYGMKGYYLSGDIIEYIWPKSRISKVNTLPPG